MSHKNMDATVSLAETMRRPLTGYAVYFNRKYHRSGYLLQNRYKSVLCEEEPTPTSRSPSVVRLTSPLFRLHLLHTTKQLRAKGGTTMNVPRTTPAATRERVQAGKALLVCAYESEELCNRNRLEGGMMLAEFTARLPALGKEAEIVFYCA